MKDAAKALLLDVPERLETASLTLVAEKCAFTLERIHRNARRDKAGELADKCMYAITF